MCNRKLLILITCQQRAACSLSASAANVKLSWMLNWDWRVFKRTLAQNVTDCTNMLSKTSAIEVVFCRTWITMQRGLGLQITGGQKKLSKLQTSTNCGKIGDILFKLVIFKKVTDAHVKFDCTYNLSSMFGSVQVELWIIFTQCQGVICLLPLTSCQNFTFLTCTWA